MIGMFQANLLSGRRALITGASSGLGIHFAKVLAAHGAGVILAARRADRLREIAAQIEATGGHAVCQLMDVCDATSVRAGLKSRLYPTKA